MKTVLISCMMLCLLFVLPVTAEEAVSEQESPVVATADPTQPEYYSLESRWALRLGGGLTVSLLKLDFDKDGVFAGEAARITDDSSRSEEHAAATIGLKYAPIDFFALGISLDYNVLPLDRVNMKAGTVSFPNIETNADFGYIHNFSAFLFCEFRVPIKLSSGMVVPYAQLGLGGSAHIPDFNDKLLRIRDKVSMAVFGGLGIEIFPQEIKSFGIFVEARWHYSFADYDFTPIDNSKFTGTMDFIDLTVLVGVNLYLN